MYLLEHKNDKKIKPLFDLAFAKRPKIELYDLKKDPYQMKNVAEDSEYADAKIKMHDSLIKYLTDTKDPRVIGGPQKWLKTVYYQELDKTPRPSQEAIKALGLKKEYSYDDE